MSERKHTPELVVSELELETANSNEIYKSLGQEPPHYPVYGVSKIGIGGSQWYYCDCGRSEESKERAEFIRKACMNHDALLAACEAIAKVCDDKDHSRTTGYAIITDENARMVRAAVAKAYGWPSYEEGRLMEKIDAYKQAKGEQ